MSDKQYKNITISGLPGSGSTTLLELLKEELEDNGWIAFSGGEFMRAYAIEQGLYDPTVSSHHSATVYGEDFDRKVDYGIREKVSEDEKWIIESWLSGFMAQNVPGTLKVLMVCSNDAIRIDRLVNRDGVDVEEAKKNISNRYKSNLDKWSRMYDKEWQQWVVETGKAKASDPIDFWRADLYDLVIDTYSNNKEQTLNLVLDAIKKKKED
jgi:cytidylate kinase